MFKPKTVLVALAILLVMASFISSNGITPAASVSATVAAGDEPDPVAVNPVTHRVYVANRNSNNVTVINGSEAVDVTPPVLTITTPSDGATYDQSQSVPADYTCTDEIDGSGIATCDGGVTSGDAIDTAATGDHTFTVTGTNIAGISTTLIHHYTVAAVIEVLGAKELKEQATEGLLETRGLDPGDKDLTKALGYVYLSLGDNENAEKADGLHGSKVVWIDSLHIGKKREPMRLSLIKKP